MEKDNEELKAKDKATMEWLKSIPRRLLSEEKDNGMSTKCVCTMTGTMPLYPCASTILDERIILDSNNILFPHGESQEVSTNSLLKKNDSLQGEHFDVHEKQDNLHEKQNMHDEHIEMQDEHDSLHKSTHEKEDQEMHEAEKKETIKPTEGSDGDDEEPPSAVQEDVEERPISIEDEYSELTPKKRKLDDNDDEEDNSCNKGCSLCYMKRTPRRYLGGCRRHRVCRVISCTQKAWFQGGISMQKIGEKSYKVKYLVPKDFSYLERLTFCPMCSDRSLYQRVPDRMVNQIVSKVPKLTSAKPAAVPGVGIRELSCEEREMTIDL